MKLDRLIVAGSPISRRGFLKRSAGAVGVLAGRPALGAVLAACSQMGRQQTTGVTFQLNWIKNVEFAGQWYALDKGMYKDEGLDVTFLAGGGSVDPVAAVAAGSAMLGF